MLRCVPYEILQSRALKRCFIVAACGFFFTCLSEGIPAQQKEAAATNAVAQVDRFKAVATVVDKGGKLTSVRAEMRHWVIAGHRRIPEFPEHGFLLIELRGGKLTTTLNGKEEKHVGGDIWVVPAGSKMAVEATGETTAFDVLVLNLP